MRLRKWPKHTCARREPLFEKCPSPSARPPQTGSVAGRAVAKHEEYVAVATAANSFFVVAPASLGRDIQIGERLSLRFHQGRASIDNGRDRTR